MAVVIATGVTATGGREVLGVDIGDSEDEVFWRGFLRSLKERGLQGTQLVISDQHSGLVAALRRVLQGASHQRCRVHFARNLLALVPKSHKDMVAAVFRTIFAQPARPSPPPGTASATSSPQPSPRSGHRPKCWPSPPSPAATGPKCGRPTRLMERVNKEIKRRARVVGIFPNEPAVIRLVGAILADMRDEWQVSDRRYLSEGSMAQLKPTSNNETVAAISAGD
jgi:putative transposase